VTDRYGIRVEPVAYNLQRAADGRMETLMAALSYGFIS